MVDIHSSRMYNRMIMRSRRYPLLYANELFARKADLGPVVYVPDTVIVTNELASHLPTS